MKKILLALPLAMTMIISAGSNKSFSIPPFSDVATLLTKTAQDNPWWTAAFFTALFVSCDSHSKKLPQIMQKDIDEKKYGTEHVSTSQEQRFWGSIKRWHSPEFDIVWSGGDQKRFKKRDIASYEISRFGKTCAVLSGSMLGLYFYKNLNK